MPKANIWSTNTWYQTPWILGCCFWYQFQPQDLGTITPSTAQILRSDDKNLLVGKEKKQKRGSIEPSQLWLLLFFFFFLQALVTVAISLRRVVTVQRGPTPAYLNSLVPKHWNQKKPFASSCGCFSALKSIGLLSLLPVNWSSSGSRWIKRWLTTCDMGRPLPLWSVRKNGCCTELLLQRTGVVFIDILTYHTQLVEPWSILVIISWQAPATH